MASKMLEFFLPCADPHGNTFHCRSDRTGRDPVFLADVGGSSKCHSRDGEDRIKDILSGKAPKQDWFAAQLMHYGLESSGKKEALVDRLYGALRAGQLSMPPSHLSEMEAEMKSRFRATTAGSLHVLPSNDSLTKVAPLVETLPVGTPSTADSACCEIFHQGRSAELSFVRHPWFDTVLGNLRAGDQHGVLRFKNASAFTQSGSRPFDLRERSIWDTEFGALRPCRCLLEISSDKQEIQGEFEDMGQRLVGFEGRRISSCDERLQKLMSQWR